MSRGKNLKKISQQKSLNLTYLAFNRYKDPTGKIYIWNNATETFVRSVRNETPKHKKKDVVDSGHRGKGDDNMNVKKPVKDDKKAPHKSTNPNTSVKDDENGDLIQDSEYEFTKDESKMYLQRCFAIKIIKQSDMTLIRELVRTMVEHGKDEFFAVRKVCSIFFN